MTGGAIRLRIVELGVQRYETREVLLDSVRALPFEKVVSTETGYDLVAGEATARVSLTPLRVLLVVDGEVTMEFNERDLLQYELKREKPVEKESNDESASKFEEERIDDNGDHPKDEYDALDPLENLDAVPETETEERINDIEDLERVDDDGDVFVDEDNYNYEDSLNADKLDTFKPASPDANDDAGKETAEVNVAERDGWWSETFSSHTDSKPNGPTAISFDVKFTNSEHVFGIPEHATDFSLKATVGEGVESDPYRMYNLDVFEFELDEPMALYGSVPFMMAHTVGRTVGVFWLNSAEMWIDVDQTGIEKGVKDALSGLWSRMTGGDAQRTKRQQFGSTRTHWISESGIVDLFLFAGPTPQRVLQQYYALTGAPTLPPLFSLAYHQCRWNYRDIPDVYEVNDQFNQQNIPYDVLWLDIEHTDGKRYFTWDKHNFETPTEMLDHIAGHGRRMVTIVDPHIKRDTNYEVHSDALSKDLYVRTADNSSSFDGWCWPGSSHWPDFTRADVREWWAGRFSYDQYKGSTPALFTWNDMNEPSVFNGPEVTMQKDLMHAEGVEHRDVHNIYGMLVHRATAEGLLARDEAANVRPFVLSRAFFAGTQRWGAIWTGDNKADWDHLRSSVPMLLSLSVGGIPFAGADVGGFFGNPNGELMTRWYQAGAFQPFFRGHAHLDAKRREPWLFGEPYTSAIREAIRLRYQYLPLWYTLMHSASVSGDAPMRPLWFEYPTDSSLFAVDDEFMVGNALLVKPVGFEAQTETKILLPKDTWYDLWTFEKHVATEATALQVQTPLNRFPLFQRAGTIVPRRDRARRSTTSMRSDPFTLVIAVAQDENNRSTATGKLYIDDEVTTAYESGAFAVREFVLDGSRLSNRKADDNSGFESALQVERVILLGWTDANSCAKLAESNADYRCWFDAAQQRLEVGALRASVMQNWTIEL